MNQAQAPVPGVQPGVQAPQPSAPQVDPQTAPAVEQTPRADDQTVAGARTVARAEEQSIRQRVENQILAGAAAPTSSLPGNGRERETELRAGVAGAREQVTVSQPRVEPGNTQPTQQIEVQREATVGLNPSLPFRKLEGGANAGVAASAQFNMTSADVEAIRRGDRPMPDLNDPRTLPVGSSATLRAETQTSTAAGGAFRGVGMYQQTTQSQGQQVQVERLSEDRVRVSTGPTRGERTETEGRHTLAPLSAVTGEQNLRLSQTTGSREFDISTPEGRTAYQQHLAQSLQPNAGQTGPVSEATIEAQKRVGAAACPSRLRASPATGRFPARR